MSDHLIPKFSMSSPSAGEVNSEDDEPTSPILIDVEQAPEESDSDGYLASDEATQTTNTTGDSKSDHEELVKRYFDLVANERGSKKELLSAAQVVDLDTTDESDSEEELRAIIESNRMVPLLEEYVSGDDQPTHSTANQDGLTMSQENMEEDQSGNNAPTMLVLPGIESFFSILRD
ncbi:unnamed protein product [Orchesella dallaii]|uniref:Uncharacterized protein n=1 Tax=Orchesella dallaii TaxID=48710 RepID=A0ABP1RMU5_9HEXA